MAVMSSVEADLGSQPAAYIAYSPLGKGLECAVTYYVDGFDVQGWWIGFMDGDYTPAFFKLERFFTDDDTVFLATEDADLYGGWRYIYSKSQPRLHIPIAMDDELCHKLSRLQEAFFNEWLWVRDGSDHQAEEHAYAEAELAVQRVNIRYGMLGKFKKEDAIWTYESHDLHLNVLTYLAQRWPMEYGKPE